jgi:hypothetical protein
VSTRFHHFGTKLAYFSVSDGPLAGAELVAPSPPAPTGCSWLVFAFPSITEDLGALDLAAIKANESEVIIKAMATPVVTLLRNGTAPALPNIVWLLPPNAAPRSDPFPDCKRIEAINPTQISTWRIMSNVIIFPLSYRVRWAHIYHI